MAGVGSLEVDLYGSRRDSMLEHNQVLRRIGGRVNLDGTPSSATIDYPRENRIRIGFDVRSSSRKQFEGLHSHRTEPGWLL